MKTGSAEHPRNYTSALFHSTISSQFLHRQASSPRAVTEIRAGPLRFYSRHAISTPTFLYYARFHHHTCRYLSSAILLVSILATFDFDFVTRIKHGADPKGSQTTTTRPYLRCLSGLQESQVQMQRRPATVFIMCQTRDRVSF